jgi:hypothetical protein
MTITVPTKSINYEALYSHAAAKVIHSWLLTMKAQVHFQSYVAFLIKWHQCWWYNKPIRGFSRNGFSQSLAKPRT